MKIRTAAVAALAMCLAATFVPASAEDPATDPTGEDTLYSAHEISPGPDGPRAKYQKYADFTDVYGGHDGEFIYVQVQMKNVITPKVLRKDKEELPGTYLLVLDMYFNDGSFNQWRLAELQIDEKKASVSVANNEYDVEQDCLAEAALDREAKTFTAKVAWPRSIERRRPSPRRWRGRASRAT